MINDLKKILFDEKLACIIEQNGVIYKETAKGVLPIVNHYEAGHLKDAVIVDKVIGKASALFMLLGRPKAIHGMVISEPALEIIKKSGVPYSYDEVVENIINREGTGLCPMESSVIGESDLQKGAEIILCKMKK